MPERSAVHRLTRPFAALLAVAACSADIADEPASPYLTDARYRRGVLVASLVNPGNEYSRLRLAHYATGTSEDWERLPEWNPAVSPIRAGELEAGNAASLPLAPEAARALALPTLSLSDDASLVALGQEAFARYPVQLIPALNVAIASAKAAQDYGLWVDEPRGVGGLVRVALPDGSSTLALTCATCHAVQRDRQIEDGAPNASFDLGRILLAADDTDPVVADALSIWGAGRVDVSTGDGSEPQRIPDLRPVRWLSHLHQDATVSLDNRDALAIRIETLIITSSAQVLRPPRIVALALARYLESLADKLPGQPPSTLPGAAIFARVCSSCHAPPSFTGPPVALALVATDPELGQSRDRGTGAYRVPSLHGVATRGPLLHDASIPSIEALFDPQRVSEGWTGRLHGHGPVPGHLYGLSFSDAERGDLIRYLRRL